MLNLNQFTGGEETSRHFTGLLYTEGVRYVAETYGAYWLIDAIASYQHTIKTTRLREFQLWELLIAEGKVSLTMRGDTGEPEVIRQEIEFTDFPDSIRLYVCNNTLLLPSEY